MKEIKGNISFSERQRFTQSWLWIILACINLIFIIGFTKQVIMGKPFGNDPLSDVSLTIVGMVVMLLSVFFFYLRLDTEINETGIYYRFFPFQVKMRKITWVDIIQVY